MKKSNTLQHQAPSLLKALVNLVDRLRQHPDIYPIRYYKKGRRFRRNWQEPIVK